MMILETHAHLTDLPEEQAVNVQGGWFFNIPWYSPVAAVTSSNGGKDPLSYDSRTTAQNYSYVSAWQGGTKSGGDYSGISTYLSSLTGWWAPGGNDPRKHNGSAIQVFWG